MTCVSLQLSDPTGQDQEGRVNGNYAEGFGQPACSPQRRGRLVRTSLLNHAWLRVVFADFALPCPLHLSSLTGIRSEGDEPETESRDSGRNSPSPTPLYPHPGVNKVTHAHSQQTSLNALLCSLGSDVFCVPVCCVFRVVPPRPHQPSARPWS